MAKTVRADEIEKVLILYSTRKAERQLLDFDDLLSSWLRLLTSHGDIWSLFPQGAKLPDSQTVKDYADSVPDDFLFTVKIPNSITLTHYYAKQPKASKNYANLPNPYFLDVGLLSRFLEILEPLKDKLGPLMFQFEYFNKQKMPSRKAFLKHLDAFFDQVPSRIRLCHRNTESKLSQRGLFDFLRERKLGFVLL